MTRGAHASSPRAVAGRPSRISDSTCAWYLSIWGQQRAPIDIADGMQPRQAGNGEPLANLDRLAWAQAIGLQAQVPGPRLATGGDQDLVALDLLPVAQGHGDLRADPEDR